MEASDKGWRAELQELACVVQESTAQGAGLTEKVIALLEKQDEWMDYWSQNIRGKGSQ